MMMIIIIIIKNNINNVVEIIVIKLVVVNDKIISSLFLINNNIQWNLRNEALNNLNTWVIQTNDGSPNCHISDATKLWKMKLLVKTKQAPVSFVGKKLIRYL